MSVNPLSLPSNFQTITQARMLSEPDSQYVFALLAKLALGLAMPLPTPADFVGPNGQVGGGMLNPMLDPVSQQLKLVQDPRVAGLARIFQPKIDLGRRVGDTIRFNRPTWGTTSGTEAQQELAPDQVIGKTPLQISGTQASITIKKYGGPYGSAGVQPFKLDRFYDNAGLVAQADIVGKHMKRSFDVWLNTTIQTRLINAAGTTNVVRPKNMTDDNTPTLVGAYPLDYDTLLRTSTTMSKTNLPTFPDGRRILFVSPEGMLQLRSDKQFRDAARFFEQYNTLFNAEVQITPEFVIIQCNTLPVTANTSSININTAIAVAPGVDDSGGPIGVAVARNPETAFSTDTNYGESLLLIWLAYLGFEVFDNRFVYAIKHGASF